jgi:hypothetical protein
MPRIKRQTGIQTSEITGDEEMQKELMRMRIEDLELKITALENLLRSIHTIFVENIPDMTFFEEEIRKSLGE